MEKCHGAPKKCLLFLYSDSVADSDLKVIRSGTFVQVKYSVSSKNQVRADILARGMCGQKFFLLRLLLEN